MYCFTTAQYIKTVMRATWIKEEPSLKVIFYEMLSVHKNQSKLQATVFLFVAVQIFSHWQCKKEDFLNYLFFSKLLILYHFDLNRSAVLCRQHVVLAKDQAQQLYVDILFTKVIFDGILILPHHPNKKLFLCLVLLQFSTCCMSSKEMDHNKVRMRLKVS